MSDPGLFDADEYLDPRKVGSKPRRQRSTLTPDGRQLYVVPDEPGQEWHVVATLGGSLPEAHLRRVGRGNELEAIKRNGGLITRCEKVGRSVHVLEPGKRAYLCEECMRQVWG